MTLPAHDAVLAGDSLSSIILNFEWRKIIAAALEYYFSHSETTLGLANDDLLNNLFIDLYNLENFGSAMSAKTYNLVLSANQTTTSLTFVAMTGTNFTFTPSKSNVMITVQNLTLSMSGVSATVETRILFGTYTANYQAAARMQGTTAREMQAAAIFENVTIGLAKDFSIEWRVSGGTATVSSAQWLVYTITEWDD